jgi:hypothetical protein
LLAYASKTPPLPCFGHLDARKHRTCRALATWALERAAEYASNLPSLPCFGHLDARKHRTCRALATSAPEGAARAPARCPRASERLENCTATGALERAAEYASNLPSLPCFGHLDARKHRTCRALAPSAPEGAARAPARCPRGARKGRSSPRLVPPKRSKGLLDPSRLQVGARASARCPPCVQSALKTARPLGRSNGLPNMPRTYRPCRALATWTPENTAPAVLWPLRRSSPRSVPPGRSKGLLKPLLGARGRSRPHLVPRHCPSRASGHFGRMTSQAR